MKTAIFGPQMDMPLNTATSLSSGLVAFVVPVHASPVNLAGSLYGTAWTSTGNMPQTCTPVGNGWAQLGTTGGIYGPIASLATFTIAWFGSVVAFQATSPFISQLTPETTTTGNFHLIRFGDAGLANNKVQFLTNSGPKLAGTNAWPTGVPLLVVATASSSGKSIYVNNVLDASDATVPTSGSVTLGFGYSAFGARGLNGFHAYQAVWNRPLSASEIQTLSANPWMLFDQRTRNARAFGRLAFRGWGRQL